MTIYDFKRNGYDSYVYFRKFDDGSFTYLLLYGDTMPIVFKDR